jgi:hypothetical protein
MQLLLQNTLMLDDGGKGALYFLRAMDVMSVAVVLTRVRVRHLFRDSGEGSLKVSGCELENR